MLNDKIMKIKKLDNEKGCKNDVLTPQENLFLISASKISNNRKYEYERRII